MKEKFLLLTFLLVGLSKVYGQENLLTGNVVDEENRVIDIFNVIILNATDSSYIKGEIFYKGHFEMNHNHLGNSLLQISSLGYEDMLIPVYLRENTFLKNIVMKTKVEHIKEIVVSGSRPIVRQVQGNTIIQIANTPLIHLGTIVEILKRSPGLKLEDGSLVVFGKGEPLIFIDGKQVQSFAEVEMLQPNEIISIEIDRNPSAKYMATARAVLNIKTKRRKLEGISLQLFNTSAFGRKCSDNTGIRLNFNKGRFDNFLGYDFNNSRYKNYVEAFEYNYQGDYVLKSITDAVNLHNYNTHQLLLGSTYHISSKNSISLQYNMIKKRHEEWDSENQIISGGTEGDQVFDILGKCDSSSPIHILNTTYNFKVDSTRNFISSMDYAHFHYSGLQSIVEDIISTGETEFKDLRNENSSNVYVFRSEYSTPVLNKIDFFFGIRCSHMDTKNQTIFTNYSNVMENYSGLTDILENNYALYFTFGRRFHHVGFNTGLRYEKVDYKAKSNNEIIRDKVDNHLFPSFNIFSLKCFDNLELSLKYTSRISRPSISELDPSLHYLSSISYRKGNPLLKNTIIRNISLSTELFEKLDFSIEYDYQKYPRILTGVSDTNNPDIIIFSPINIDNSSMYTAKISFNNKWGPYEINSSFNVEFPSVMIPFLEDTLHRTHPSWDLSIGNSITLSKSTYASCSFEYWSKYVDLMTDFYPTYDLSLSLTQYMWKRRLQINIEANDLFRKYFGDWRDKYGNIESGEYLSRDNRNVKITVRYNFNNYKNVYKRKSESNQEINRIQ